jgi:anti-sigma regulatory factor (Ser/Thr protein kinase)
MKTAAPANMENLEKLQKFIKNFVQRQGFSDARVMQIELACEEALVNIFNYAYPNEHEGNVEIECRADVMGDCIIELIDSGRPFNLKAFPEPDIRAGISKRSIGGLGTVLIKKFTDGIDYRRHENKNILTLRFIKRDQ